MESGKRPTSSRSKCAAVAFWRKDDNRGFRVGVTPRQMACQPSGKATKRGMDDASSPFGEFIRTSGLD